MKTRITTSSNLDRRGFLKQVSSGVFLSTLGLGLSSELGFAHAALGLANSDDEDPLGFGQHARLADLLTHTPLEKLQALILKEHLAGATAQQLIAAATLANARAFGGEDYDGYHAFMALMPAYEMSASMSGRHALLPIMKVLYRNTARMQDMGANENPKLRGQPATLPADELADVSVEAVVNHVTRERMARAESSFDAVLQRDPSASIESLIPVVCQEEDVHRVVLAWRAWDLLRLTGSEHARTLLRQSVRQCVSREGFLRNKEIRQELPQVMDESGVLAAPLGQRQVDDAWISERALELYNANRKEGASIVAHALREGVEPAALGQALSLAATHLMLRQVGSTRSAPSKPIGSVHGAGTGVHSSDTVAAWRGMARFGSERQTKLALVAGGYHVAGQGGFVAKDIFAYSGVAVPSENAKDLLGMLQECVKGQDQSGAARAASCYVKNCHDLAPLLTLLRDSSLASDGALHAEKYYRTQVEALEGDRPAFRELHVAALARVCASQACAAPAGREQALELLG